MENILGNIKCVEVKEMEDGSAEIIFDVDDDFKDKYTKHFGLEEWSQEHFQNMLVDALESRVREHKLKKGD